MRTYSEKLRDPRWQKKRLQILERDDFTCICCETTEIELHVHHREYSKGDPWEVDDLSLVTLCKDCHALSEKVLQKMLPMEINWDTNRQVAIYFTPSYFGVYDQHTGFSLKIKLDQFQVFADRLVTFWKIDQGIWPI